MPYEAYAGLSQSSTYDDAWKRVKGLWTLARREFGIKATFEFTFAVMNPESIAKLPGPHSHVVPRKEQANLIILRVSKAEMDSPLLLGSILPREMAHIVCKIDPAHGNPYTKDGGWLKVYGRLVGKC